MRGEKFNSLSSLLSFFLSVRSFRISRSVHSILSICYFSLSLSLSLALSLSPVEEATLETNKQWDEEDRQPNRREGDTNIACGYLRRGGGVLRLRGRGRRSGGRDSERFLALLPLAALLLLRLDLNLGQSVLLEGRGEERDREGAE